MGTDRRRNEHEDETRIERVDPLVGSVLDGRYRIDFRIAAGGFGAIYHATQVESGDQFALKVLHTELATNDARVIARFRREGATLAQLRDPHTVTAYELGEDPDGPLYIVMELLHGESLYEVYRSHGPLPWQRVVAIARMVCSSLAEAHALGIIHRDLKPANIHLERRDGNPDFVKVLDFGIAKIVREGDEQMELTQAGQMIGTFDYMAPEQMVGGQCTAGTDIYTLGVVVYEMIAGRRPFEDANSPTSMLAALLTQTPPPLSERAEVPRELDRIIARCLEREPQHRYPSVEELDAELERLVVGDEGVTRQVHAPPTLHADEVTMIAASPRRASSPHARRERETPTATPTLLRRDGSGPVADARGSQPAFSPPRAPQPTPTPGPTVTPTPVPVGSPPRHEPRVAPPSHDPRVAPPGHDPRVAPPGHDPRAAQPTPPGPLPHDPRMAPPGHDPRVARTTPGALPVAPMPPWQPPAGYPPNPHDPAAWPHGGPGPARPTYDMASVRDREVVIRRIVWALALVLGVILVVVVASRL